MKQKPKIHLTCTLNIDYSKITCNPQTQIFPFRWKRKMLKKSIVKKIYAPKYQGRGTCTGSTCKYNKPWENSTGLTCKYNKLWENIKLIENSQIMFIGIHTCHSLYTLYTPEEFRITKHFKTHIKKISYVHVNYFNMYMTLYNIHLIISG